MSCEDDRCPHCGSLRVSLVGVFVKQSNGTYTEFDSYGYVVRTGIPSSEVEGVLT